MIYREPVVHEIPLITQPTLFIMGADDHNAPGRPNAPEALRPKMGQNADLAKALAAKMANAQRRGDPQRRASGVSRNTAKVQRADAGLPGQIALWPRPFTQTIRKCGLGDGRGRQVLPISKAAPALPSECQPNAWQSRTGLPVVAPMVVMPVVVMPVVPMVPTVMVPVVPMMDDANGASDDGASGDAARW